MAGATIKASIMSATPIQARRHTHARTHRQSCHNLPWKMYESNKQKPYIISCGFVAHSRCVCKCVVCVCESIAKELVWFDSLSRWFCRLPTLPNMAQIMLDGNLQGLTLRE